MLLQYFKKKENKDKHIAKSVYNEIILVIQNIFLKHSKIKNDFNSSFEITTLILFSIFFGSKKKLSKKNQFLIQELMNLFTEDLDYSMRINGIGDMSIGKYVKSYVKKFYFRISRYEEIFINKKKEDFNLFLINLDIFFEKHKNNVLIDSLFEDSLILIERAKKDEITKKILFDIFI